MRVLVLSDLWVPFPGGAERLIFNVARHLMTRFDVGVVTGYEHARAFDGPEVGIDLDLPLDHQGAELLRSRIEQIAPDVIVTHHIYARTFAPLLEASGIPVVQVVLNGPRLPFAALAVYISRWVKREGGDARPGDLVLTPPAFDDVVAPTHGDAIGFVKPLEHKGVGLVYRVARRLRDRRFLILRGEWQTLELIEEAENIEFLDPVDDMRDFYSRVRIMLMPSISEDAGTVAQEAALNRIPCISSSAGGLAETNGGGIRLSVQHPGRWVNAIRMLDSPSYYDRVVRRQESYLASLNHAATLDQLAERIAAL